MAERWFLRYKPARENQHSSTKLIYCCLCFDPMYLVCKMNLCPTEDVIFVLKTPCNPRKINCWEFLFHVQRDSFILLGQQKEILEVLQCNCEWDHWTSIPVCVQTLKLGVKSDCVLNNPLCCKIVAGTVQPCRYCFSTSICSESICVWTVEKEALW